MSKRFFVTNKQFILWKTKDNKLYHKIVKCHYVEYYIGYKNSYGHEVVYLIDNLEFRTRRTSLKDRYKRKLISYIEKL